MAFYHRKRNQYFLLLGVIMLFATIMLKYVLWECDLEDILYMADHPSRRHCRHEFLTAMNLSSGDQGLCSSVIRGDQQIIEKIQLNKLIAKHKNVMKSDHEFLTITKDCSLYKKTRKFIPIPLSKEEADFPIAYSMVIHENVEMFERLLRTIYTPQNIYCVHVDGKSPAVFKEAVRAIASCFENVFVASKLEKVVYASWFRVQADLNCMEDLLKSKVPWRYLLNTCGSDFPIKTNAEIVRALKVLNGKNSLESEKPSQIKNQRWQFHHQINNSVIRTTIEKKPPPISSPVFSGSAYFVVTRDFVRHIFENADVQRLLEWGKDTYSPDEFLWATLYRMPGMPGSVPYNDKFQLSDMTAMARLVKWSYLEGDISKGASYPPCTGAHRHSVCVYGAGDLHWMLQYHHLFANKFDPRVDAYAIQCLEHYLRHKALYGEEL